MGASQARRGVLPGGGPHTHTRLHGTAGPRCPGQAASQAASQAVSRPLTGAAARRLLDYGVKACAEHVTGLEKWPGFPNLPESEARELEARRAARLSESSPAEGGV